MKNSLKTWPLKRKIFKLATLLLVASFAALNGQEGGTYQSYECDNQNLTLKQMGEENPLFTFLIDEDRIGILEVHPFHPNEIGGWDVFANSLTTDTDFTYKYVGMTESRLFGGYFYRYQQYYKDVPIENGGFTILIEPDDPQAIIGPPCPGCPPVEPCGLISMLSPHIYEGIDMEDPSNPGISESSIINYLPGDIATVDSNILKIVNNIQRNCDYKLVWQSYYTDASEAALIAWIDAQTGELIYTTSQHNNKNAPTADWGTQKMNDQIDGSNTVLKNDRLTAHDMSNSTTLNFSNNQIPTSPITRNWNTTDASTQLF